MATMEDEIEIPAEDVVEVDDVPVPSTEGISEEGDAA